MVKRNTSWKIIGVGVVVCFLLSIQLCFSQSLHTITDRKDILIGEQIKLKIKAKVPVDAVIDKWLVLPESISHFDIVESSKPDTLNFKDESKTIEQTIIITSFDSGRWVFPALPVAFKGSASKPLQMMQSDSFYVNVSYSPADSTNQLRDIKPIIKVFITDYFWYYIVGGMLLLLLIGFLLYRFFKKKKELQPTANLSCLSAFDEAMVELSKIEKLNMNVADEVKNFHTRLAHVFKNYLGRKQTRNLMNKTTDDILINLSGNNLSAENFSNLATALRSTDAVKFAKYLPQPDESINCLQKIKETIILNEQRTSKNI